MSARFRLSLLWHQWVHRTLRFFSRTYRESSDLQYTLNCETSSHTSTKAKLAVAEAQLATQSTQIQSLTYAAQRAGEEAASLRGERDRAREQALEAREAAQKPMEQLADWLARGQRREPIFGNVPPPPAEPESMQEGPIGGVRGRAVARLETEEGYRVSMKELQEIQVRQRAVREAAMQPIHLDGEPQ